jgi:nicotinate-nucleotide adenylyltransferase
VERLKAYKRLGIFGGTFDPPHIGHLILAAEAHDQLRLDKIIWILTPYPPHKNSQKITDITYRTKMVALAIDDNPFFEFSRVDIDRPAPHYAVDTMLILRNKHPNDELFYIMGLDSLNDLPAWHNPSVFISLCNGIIVMARQGEVLMNEQLFAGFAGLQTKIHYLTTPMIEISGTEIRARVYNEKQYRYLVPANVYHFISDNHLYQN